MKPWMRIVSDVLVALMLTMLPALIAGCAAAVAHAPPRPESQAYSSNDVSSYESRDTIKAPGAATPHGFANVESGSARATGADLVPPQSLPASDEELWVIQKAAGAKPQAADDDVVPATGALMTRAPRTNEVVAVPLRHTDVKASVAGYIATVDVTQEFHNPYDGKIEAVYVFPLPHNAAVNEFLMTVGERKIRGIIRERQEAQRVYNEAKRQGYVASLLTQERPNIFTQSVANIEPGKRIDINIKYFNTLSYSDGWYEFAFPMVVGPRFNPPSSTDGIGAVGRGAPGDSRQKTEVQFLRPGERSGHDIALAVQLDAGVPVEAIESRSHRVAVKKQSPRRAEVVLDDAERIPNRDFLLRWKVAGEGVKSGLIVHRDDRAGQGEGGGGYFALMLVPPENLKRLPRSPLEMVFTLDVSGSMQGQPIEQAKSAVRYALTHMGRDDTFQVVRFSGSADAFANGPVPATPQNVREALRFIEGTDAGGGTMMIEGIRRSLEFPADESRPRCVAFLTDGFIGNEAEILGALHGALGRSRVFSFGVGTAVNRYLMEHMAKLGDGAVAYIGLQDRNEGSDVMAAYFERISHPALTNISIEWGGAKVDEMFPQRVPDLFVGKPVILTGRFTGAAPEAVRVTGKVRGEAQAMQVTANAGDVAGAEKALPLVWARMKIADLADRATYESVGEEAGDLPRQIRQVALDYGLMSAYTAFVAVDSLTRTAGDHGTTVAVPVPVPAGVRYETTVSELNHQPGSN
jgi:Ca-activated chloride channel family protein